MIFGSKQSYIGNTCNIDVIEQHSCFTIQTSNVRRSRRGQRKDACMVKTNQIYPSLSNLCMKEGDTLNVSTYNTTFPDALNGSKKSLTEKSGFDKVKGISIRLCCFCYFFSVSGYFASIMSNGHCPFQRDHLFCSLTFTYFVYVPQLYVYLFYIKFRLSCSFHLL